jgi:CHAD domain-containing protein
MGKADEIAGLECSADALRWAAEVLRARFDEIVNLRGAVVLDSGDIEAVHDMRVATRRLRSALRDFAPVLRKSPLRSVNKDLKKLADSLGAARDLDVAIVALEELKTKASDKAVKAGIQKLVDERREKRQEAQLDLRQALAVSAIEDLQKRFHGAVEKAARPKKRSKRISFTNAGRAAVTDSLQEFCHLSASLYAPQQVKKLHKLRISAKRLRYAIELFTACWGKHIEPFAAEIAEMQSYLGEVHDADTWIESFTKSLLKNDEEISQTNIWLLSRFVKLRTKNYRSAIELWRKWKTKHFLEKLRKLVISAQ